MESFSFDQAIFNAGFQLDGVHLVEASAGTGKTYNIQNIYARLVMEKGFRVSEIEVMTYTEAATKELHERLRTILKDLQCRFCEPPQNCPGRDAAERDRRNQRADRLILCAAPERRGEARLNVELALLEFDSASISTIHGFCQRILTRCTFETGINFTAEIEDHKTEELNALAEDWWRKRPAGLPSAIQLSALKTYLAELAGKSGYILKKGFDEAANCLLDAAQSIILRYEEARQEREKLSFDDLLCAVRDALRADSSGALTARLRKQMKAALIDEFQDTDPVQYEIFERLFLDGNPNPLFFVGDPKQAIYAFRGGDIYTYLKAKGVCGQSFFSLEVNHRSTSRMMKAVNAMFMDEPGDKELACYTFGNEKISYASPVRVEAEPATVGGVLRRPFGILELPVLPQLPRKDSDAKQKMKLILELIARQVLALLDEKDGDGRNVFSPEDIAILTNSNSRNKEIRKKLLACHIPCVIRKSGNVFASPVAAEFRIFLLAVLSPDDLMLLRAALTTVFYGMPLEELPEPDHPEALLPGVEKFTALNNLWRSGGFAAMIAGMEETGYREKLARRTDGERQLADIEQIIELMFAALKQQGNSAEKLVSWLSDRIDRSCRATPNRNIFLEDDESEMEEYARELESDSDAVKIMTIHASKGLQFPVVLLPDCWHVADLRIGLPTEYHSANQLVLSVDEYDKESTRAECMMEKMRLLYVAMTRAVERSVLFIPHLLSFDPSEPLRLLLGNLMRRCKDDPPYEIIPAQPDFGGGFYHLPGNRRELLPARTPRKMDTAPTKGSYSSLSPSLLVTDAGEEGKDEDQEVSRYLQWRRDPGSAEHPIFEVGRGAAVGSCWHNILEKVSFDADDGEISRIAEKELGDSGFLQQENMLALTRQMVRKVLEFPLISPSGEKFTLVQVSRQQRLSEQEFNFSTGGARSSTAALQEILLRHWGGEEDKAEFLRAVQHWNKSIPRGFMTGFIDLIFQHGEYFYIIDWKSNALLGAIRNFSPSGIRREMAAHGYFFQYLLYSVVLHRYLKQILGDSYSWEKNFGGIRYYFLRGIAAGGVAPVYADRPSAALLDELGEALGLEA